MLLLIGSALGCSPLLAAPAVDIDKRTGITLEVRPLTAETISEGGAPYTTLVLNSNEPVESRLGLAWPEPDDRSTLVLSASRVTPRPGNAFAVELDARLTLPDGSTVHADRGVSFDDETTTLFEVYRYGDRSLTVAIKATTTTEIVVSSRRTPGSQVRFRLEIVRVTEGRQTSLEDNYLNTLVGEPVTYSFRLAETPGAESVSITLKPLQLHAGIAEIDIEITGKMTLDEEVVLIGRTEHWLASRGATSTLAFEAGDPPSGYRFLVTARF